MSTFLYVVFVLFSVIVIHEGGHAIVGYVLKRPLNSVNVGGGPLLFQCCIRGVWIRFRLIPLFGYVDVVWLSKKPAVNIAFYAGGPTACAIASIICFGAGYYAVAVFFACDVLLNLNPYCEFETDGKKIQRELRRARK